MESQSLMALAGTWRPKMLVLIAPKAFKPENTFQLESEWVVSLVLNIKNYDYSVLYMICGTLSSYSYINFCDKFLVTGDYCWKIE